MKNEYKDLSGGIGETSKMFDSVYPQLEQELNYIISNKITNEDRIGHLFDNILNMCFMKDGSHLYKKLCQYYYSIDKDTTLRYIESYNDFFDEEHSLDINMILAEMKSDKARSLDAMGIIIRKAEAEDLKNIQTLNNMLFEYEYEGWDKDLKLGWPFEEAGKKYFLDMINNHIVYIALDNNKPIGYLAGNIKAENNYLSIKVAEIDNMFVDNEYRGNNIGTILIDKFKEYCKEKGIHTFKVNASAPNIKAIEFYKRNGFTEHDITLWCKI